MIFAGRPLLHARFLIVTLLLVLGPLALVAGVDSRIDEASRR